MPHEENRRVGGRRNRESYRSDPLGTPAIRQADHEHTRAGRGLNDAAAAGRDQNRLGDDPDDLLHEQRGTREQPARVAAPECRVGVGAEQAEGGAQRRCQPRGELDRRPVVVGTPERRDDRAAGRSRPAVRSPTSQGVRSSRWRAARRAAVRRATRGRLGQYEVDGLLRREEGCLGSSGGGGVRSDAAIPRAPLAGLVAPPARSWRRRVRDGRS